MQFRYEANWTTLLVAKTLLTHTRNFGQNTVVMYCVGGCSSQTKRQKLLVFKMAAQAKQKYNDGDEKQKFKCKYCKELIHVESTFNKSEIFCGVCGQVNDSKLDKKGNNNKTKDDDNTNSHQKL